tara:strand:+ start:624 stop:1049 length:426 start_codon:yes stop_codon:yes gene_type:complete
MAKIKFNDTGTSTNITSGGDGQVNVTQTGQQSDNVIVPNQENLNVQTTSQDLNKVKVTQHDTLRVVVGAPTQGTFVVGTDGPIGPTGPTGPGAVDSRITKYFYGIITPTDAITGDKWFQTEIGIEFTYLNYAWLQLYRNLR